MTLVLDLTLFCRSQKKVPQQTGKLGSKWMYKTFLPSSFWPDRLGPAGGAHWLELTLTGQWRPVPGGLFCLPLPPLGWLPSETVVDNHGLSQLLHVFALSVPPPPPSSSCKLAAALLGTPLGQLILSSQLGLQLGVTCTVSLEDSCRDHSRACERQRPGTPWKEVQQ